MHYILKLFFAPHSSFRRKPESSGGSKKHGWFYWIPAFAGMTGLGDGLGRIGFTAVAPLFAFTLFVTHALAASPLVTPEWVVQNIGKPGVVFLDLSGKGAYAAGHVPGAVNTSYGKDKWRVKKGKIKGVLPPTGHLEKLIGRLGISNASHVVLMHRGVSAAETGIATRVYWTFKVLGHDNVSILDGGMLAYLANKKNPLEKGFVKPKPASFVAKVNTAYLATAKDVRAAMDTGGVLLDSRPPGQHLGINKSGSITRTGAIPGSYNVPGRWMTVNDRGKFRSVAELKAIYAAKNVPNGGNRIVYCNTGHWASLGWFIEAELLGNKKAKMYDGSMADWSRQPVKTHPVNVKVKLQ